MKHGLLVILILFTSCDSDKKVKEKEKEKEKQQQSSPVAAIENVSDKEFVCFVYHRFGDDRFPTTNISVKDFESHLSWLKQKQYQVLNLSDAIEYMKSDEPTRPTAVITIDDGYNSFFEKGLPLLIKYQMPATLFINTKTIGMGDYMDWQKLKFSIEQNVEIGNHTHSHAYFLNESSTERYTSFENEIESSQLQIEQSLKLTPKVFAYPYGEFDDKMKAIVKAIGFKAAAAQNSGVISTGTDIYQLPRFPMSVSYTNMFEEKALMKSLKIIRQSPEQHLVTKGKARPELKLTINSQGLRADQMHCYVQGSECIMKVIEKTSNNITISLQATTSIMTRRRTLYTLTAPDSSGYWHWYSHLWINPSVK